MCATIREGVVKKTVPVLSGSPEADESAPPPCGGFTTYESGAKKPFTKHFPAFEARFKDL